MRATLAYTFLRIAMFAVVALVLALLGVHGITLLAVALIVSSIISIPVLSKLRDRMSTSLTGRIDGFRSRIDQGASREDGD